MVGLFPGGENSARQTRRVIYDFQSLVRFDTRIDEWASAKGNPVVAGFMILQGAVHTCRGMFFLMYDVRYPLLLQQVRTCVFSTYSTQE